MKFPSFELERIQSLYENSVFVNLTESGIEPLSLKELMNDEELTELINLPLGYGYTKGNPLLRQRIANLYRNYSEDNILAGFKIKDKDIYGLQFHPEVTHTDYGNNLLRNFIDICEMEKNLFPENVFNIIEDNIRLRPVENETERLLCNNKKLLSLF